MKGEENTTHNPKKCQYEKCIGKHPQPYRRYSVKTSCKYGVVPVSQNRREYKTHREKSKYHYNNPLRNNTQFKKMTNRKIKERVRSKQNTYDNKEKNHKNKHVNF